jgi:putative FmdB family regulatory protein
MRATIGADRPDPDILSRFQFFLCIFIDTLYHPHLPLPHFPLTDLSSPIKIILYTFTIRIYWMPLYEYICLDCKHRFDELRPMKDADTTIRCSCCESEHTSRLISVFNAQSGGRVVAGSTSASGCAGCSASSCAGCGN